MTGSLLGLWALDPDPAAVDGPRRATLRLDPHGGGIRLQLHWFDRAGEGHGRQAQLPPTALDDGAGGLLLAGTDAVGEHLDLRESPTVTWRFRRVLEDVKQVILYRRDLQMRKGKIAAQVAHASLKVLIDRDEGTWSRLSVPMDAAMASWTRARFAKVVLSVASEADLLRAHQLARDAGLPTALITDAGRTEFHGVPTKTTCAIGPARIADIDAITGRDGAIPTKLA